MIREGSVWITSVKGLHYLNDKRQITNGIPKHSISIKIGVVLHSIQLELQVTSDTQIFKSTDAPHAITQMFMFKMTHIPSNLA